MDSEQTECLGVSFSKTRARNNVESNILNKRIKQIDKQCRAQITQIESAISEEKRIARELKRQSKKAEYGSDVEQVIMRRMDNMKNNGLYALQSRSRQSRASNEQRPESEMYITGQRMSAESFNHPKMYFWSQDASTKMPVMSSFYGYRLSIQRSMTEAKLLGQQEYPDQVKREVQSADPILLRSNSVADMRRVKTSGLLRSGIDEAAFEGTPPSSRRAPPPTREKSFASDYIKSPDRSISSLEVTKQSPLIENKQLSSIESNQKLPRIDTPLNTPDINITVNTRADEEVENLLSLRTAGVATRGNLRTPRKQQTRVLQMKTRREATKEFQELLSHKHQQHQAQPKGLTDLDRSYTNIPTVMAEVNRLNLETDVDRKSKGQQYTKSTFNLNMHSAISKKVMNKTALPVAFRKNHNTFLKHYTTPVIEIKATKLTPVPMKVDTG